MDALVTTQVFVSQAWRESGRRPAGVAAPAPWSSPCRRWRRRGRSPRSATCGSRWPSCRSCPGDGPAAGAHGSPRTFGPLASARCGSSNATPCDRVSPGSGCPSPRGTATSHWPEPSRRWSHSAVDSDGRRLTATRWNRLRWPAVPRRSPWAPSSSPVRLATRSGEAGAWPWPDIAGLLCLAGRWLPGAAVTSRTGPRVIALGVARRQRNSFVAVRLSRPPLLAMALLAWWSIDERRPVRRTRSRRRSVADHGRLVLAVAGRGGLVD